MTIPFFRGLENPTANGGLSLSFRIQLNQKLTGPDNSRRGTVLARADDVWGVEWWGGSTLNFWVRAPDQRSFRAVQAHLCQKSCEHEWVRVAVSYDASKPFDAAIAMAAAGQSLKPTGAEPGTYHGKVDMRCALS